MKSEPPKGVLMSMRFGFCCVGLRYLKATFTETTFGRCPLGILLSTDSRIRSRILCDLLPEVYSLVVPVAERALGKESPMGPYKSQDEYEIIAALLQDVQTFHGDVFTTRALKLTLNICQRRLHSEGIGFLTKTLPRLAKAFDKALTSQYPLDATKLGFSTESGSQLPRFLGELFKQVLGIDGLPLHHPCIKCIKSLRQVLLLFYKYELPYTTEQEQEVIAKFVKTEQDLLPVSDHLRIIGQLNAVYCSNTIPRLEKALGRIRVSETRRLVRDSQGRYLTVPAVGPIQGPHLDHDVLRITLEAKRLLSDLFAFFDPTDINPRHGPGAVSTRERLWAKYQWTNVASSITNMYPYDAYFCASPGAVCDTYAGFASITDHEFPARVCLVPKDSRGPRLISCEPVDKQWVQQGLGLAIVQHVEKHPLTKWNVFFTNQVPNRIAALYGSRNGKYATIDLNEASDRVSLELVRLLFPGWLMPYLEACRSCSTELPNGEVLPLQKFAPMGSSLCFPILALTVWAILTAAAPDADARESIHVYGDDVIVTTASAEDAIKHLESFGLKANREKSCTKGFFRESCGMDAYMGVDTTPIRLRTVWASSPSPNVYTSWIEYSNSFYDRQYYLLWDVIVTRLGRVYGPIPSADMQLACPSLKGIPASPTSFRRRTNLALQRVQYRVPVVTSPKLRHQMDGWSMLLRYFAEAGRPSSPDVRSMSVAREPDFEKQAPFSVSTYTQRDTSVLVKRWR